MNTEVKHTALPWGRHLPVRIKHYPRTLKKSEILGPPHPVDGGDYAPLFTADKDVAEMALKCINSHQKLVDALHELYSAAGECIPQGDDKATARNQLIRAGQAAADVLAELDAA
jgi:hypothetical protein